MEKLQPILKQIFWICFSLAMILILVGWWSAKGAISTKIEERDKAVKTAFTDAEQNVSSVPNSRWTDGGTKINDGHDRNYQASARQLWQRQKAARTYPKGIERELTRIEFNSPIDDKSLRQQFAALYESYFDAQLRVIKPFRDGRGLVDVSSADVTKEDSSRWRTQRPTSQEIWKAQEDIWLLRSIFDSIAAVNSGFERIDKAPLRSLMLLQLRGGDREAPIGGGSTAGFGGGSGGDYEGGGFGGPGGGMGGGGTQVWAGFEGSLSSDLLSEEFGSVKGTGGMGGMGGSDGYNEDGGSGFGGGASEGSDDDRYVDDDENLPYRTRAFALTVRILQEEIPALLGELTNSSFPVEIVRVDAAFAEGSSVGVTNYGGGGAGAGGDEYGGDDYGDGGFGGAGGGFGGPGMGGSGMGGGFGGPGMGRGRQMGGLGGGRSNRSRKPLTKKAQKEIAQGERFLEAGLNDPALCTLRIAGLMTLYRSREENNAEAESEAAAEQETQDGGDVTPEEMLKMDESLKAADGDADADGGADMSEETEPASGDSPDTPATTTDGAAPASDNSTDGTAPAADSTGADTTSGSPSGTPEPTGEPVSN